MIRPTVFQLARRESCGRAQAYLRYKGSPGRRLAHALTDLQVCGIFHSRLPAFGRFIGQEA